MVTWLKHEVPWFRDGQAAVDPNSRVSVERGGQGSGQTEVCREICHFFLIQLALTASTKDAICKCHHSRFILAGIIHRLDGVPIPSVVFEFSAHSFQKTRKW